MATVEKMAGATLVIFLVLALALIGVGVWAFIELILWITSK